MGQARYSYFKADTGSIRAARIAGGVPRSARLWRETSPTESIDGFGRAHVYRELGCKPLLIVTRDIPVASRRLVPPQLISSAFSATKSSA